MESEQILSAVTQLLEEQRQQTTQYGSTSIALQRIDKHIEDLESSLKNINELSNDSDIKKIKDDLDEVKKQLSEMPKNVVHEKRYLLFPEYNARQYYDVILKWILYIIIATFAYFLVKFLIEALI